MVAPKKQGFYFHTAIISYGYFGTYPRFYHRKIKSTSQIAGEKDQLQICRVRRV